MSHVLIFVGVVGVLLDILLHVAQMFKTSLTPRAVALITLLSCVLGGASLVPQWNLPLLIMEGFVGALAIFALVRGKEAQDHART